MTLYAAESVTTAGLNPTARTPTASDTISGNDITPTNGCVIRVITTGTTTNVTVVDPNRTASGNPGTVTPVACPATGVREIFIPASAVDPATNLATVQFSGALTGITYEIKKY